jgi:hypothetical protein
MVMNPAGAPREDSARLGADTPEALPAPSSIPEAPITIERPALRPEDLAKLGADAALPRAWQAADAQHPRGSAENTPAMTVLQQVMLWGAAFALLLLLRGGGSGG